MNIRRMAYVSSATKKGTDPLIAPSIYIHEVNDKCYYQKVEDKLQRVEMFSLNGKFMC
jgi:hypothetical protein